MAKFDMWQQILTGLKDTSAAAPLQYPKRKPQNSHLHTGYQNALLISKDGQGNHLPRGLRAAATLSPTFLRKFTLGSSDGPEALILKNKNKDTQCKACLSMTDTCRSPVTFIPGALPPGPCPSSLHSSASLSPSLSRPPPGPLRPSNHFPFCSPFICVPGA